MGILAKLNASSGGMPTAFRDDPEHHRSVTTLASRLCGKAFGFVKRNLSEAQPRKDAANGERGARKGAAAPVPAQHWRDPERGTFTGGVCGPAVSTISEALAASVRSKLKAISGPEARGRCGKLIGSAIGPPGSPKKVRRAVAVAVPLFTTVNSVFQFSSAAIWGIVPIRVRPGRDAACWSIVKAALVMVRVVERSPPVIART